MRHHLYSIEDREYLEELLRYFPVSPPVSLDEAQNTIRDISRSWDPLKFSESLISSGNRIIFFEKVLPKLPKLLHKAMYSGVLSNAGEYRKKSDPNEGIVEFGLPIKKLTDAGCSSNGRFTGVNPDRINEKIVSVCRLIEADSVNPFHNAAVFYQKFIRIHPFYDGNGRIGRFIVDAYLYSHNMYIDWEKMKTTTRWIRQLNYCHRTTNDDESSLAYNFALKWWVHYLEKFKHVIEPE